MLKINEKVDKKLIFPDVVKWVLFWETLTYINEQNKC